MPRHASDVDIRPLLGEGLITGMRADEAVALLRERLGFGGPDDREIGRRIVEGVIEAIPNEASLLEGALEALGFCERHGLKVALASGSAESVIDSVLERFDLARRFSVVVSADRVALGKPNPAVLLLTAAEARVPANRCVVVEDALNGCIAALAARMRTIAVPEPATDGDTLGDRRRRARIAEGVRQPGSGCASRHRLTPLRPERARPAAWWLVDDDVYELGRRAQMTRRGDSPFR